jgi:hypothetical protein
MYNADISMTVVTANHSNTTHATTGAMALYYTINSLQYLATWCTRITPHSCIASPHPRCKITQMPLSVTSEYKQKYTVLYTIN